MPVIGLTGGIAMGKSTVSQMFKSAGCFIHDADNAVHELYAGDAVPWFETYFPHVVVNKSVSRETLIRHLRDNPDDLKTIEHYIHPLLAEHRRLKTLEALKKGIKNIIYDMPLLFETGMQNQVDVIVTLSAPLHIQRERALQRPHMTPEKLDFILARQWSDKKKCLNSHVIISTAVSLSHTERQVIDFLRALL